jgi:diadenosine tetraphosphate (Ap4A) HIT family hydrolase
MPCLFCDIKDDQAIHIASSQNFVSIYDENPVTEGHALIFPKKHIESFFDLNKEEVIEFYDLIREVKKLIDKVYKPDAYNIGINNGQAAGRTIHHLHLHLIPRYEGDVANPRGGVRHIIPGKGDYHEQLLACKPERKKYLSK